jgi:hypothetical protein
VQGERGGHVRVAGGMARKVNFCRRQASDVRCQMSVTALPLVFLTTAV